MLRPESGCEATYELRFPNGLEAGAVSSWFAALVPILHAHPYDRLALEVRGTRSGIEHRLRMSAGIEVSVLAQLRSAVPGARATPIENPTTEELTAGVEPRHVGAAALLAVDQPASLAAALLASIAGVKGGEVIVFQLIMRAVPRTPAYPVLEQLLSPAPALPLDPRRIELKRSLPALAVCVRIGSKAGSRDRARHLARSVAAPLGIARTGGSYFVPHDRSGPEITRRIGRADAPRLFRTWAPLALPELVALCGWPIGSPLIPGLRLGTSRHLPPPTMKRGGGILLGRTTMPGAVGDVRLPLDRLRHHLAVTAPIGSGKSTLLGSVALQAIEQKLGVIVIDWKGDLVADLRNRVDLAARDVIVIDPTARDFVVGVPNIFSGDEATREYLVDQLIGIMRRTWGSSWGPRTAALVQTALFTLARAPGTTLVDLPELLTNPAFRRRVLATVQGGVGLTDFWAWFDDVSSAERNQIVAPTLHRVRPWLLRSNVRWLLGQDEPTYNLDGVLNGKTLLINLAAGVLGDETSTIVGSLVVNQIMSAIRRRARTPENRRRTAVVILDEFQHIAGAASDFGDVLVEARGYGVGIVLGHQHLGQLPPDLRETTLANVRSRLSFATSATDAAAVAREFGAVVGGTDLLHLPAYEAVARLSLPDGVSAPFTMRSLPWEEPRKGQAPLIRRNRAKYGRGPADIDARLEAHHRGAPDEGGVAWKRKRS